MHRKLIILAALAPLLAASCTPQMHQSAQVEPEGKVIVRIVSRSRTIEARSGGAGPVYAVTTVDHGGRTAQSLDRLQQTDPALAKEIQTMHADLWTGD